MRAAVFLLAALQIGALVLLGVSGTGGPDAAGNAMSQGFVTLAGIAMAVFLVPALILAISRKAEKVALLLAVVPAATLFVILDRL